MDEPNAGFFSQIITSLLEFWKGSARNKTASMILNTAEFAPIASASTKMTVIENTGDFRKTRTPKVRSTRKLRIGDFSRRGSEFEREFFAIEQRHAVS